MYTNRVYLAFSYVYPVVVCVACVCDRWGQPATSAGDGGSGVWATGPRDRERGEGREVTDGDARLRELRPANSAQR